MSESQEIETRLARIESRLDELAFIQDLVLRLMSMTRPLAGVLEHYGATETQEQALYRLIDHEAERARGPARDWPSFAHFEMRVVEIFPERRNDREFLQMLLDTLKVERVAYRELHAHMVQQGWPIRTK